jgi:hypothetical protein
MKARKYVQEEFCMEKTIDRWHETLLELVESWKDGRRNVPRYEMIEV